MKKTIFAIAAAAMLCSCGARSTAENAGAEQVADSTEVSTVFFIRDITPENLVKIYEALGRKAEGNNVAVKLSTGESNKSNHLDTALIRPLVQGLNATIIECNTAYAGNRNTTDAHRKAAEEHGFTKIAKVDIMDAEGDTILPLTGGKHLAYDIVGKSYPDYDFTVVLSHFKGHAMGGCGGALKTQCVDSVWSNIAEQDDFLESMAEAAKAVIDHAGDKILYINVANRLSVDCDCDGNPAAPKMGDIGILASLDPVALDRASVDMVFNSTDPGKDDLIERINSRHGTHILDYGEQLGIGSQKYKIVELK